MHDILNMAAMLLGHIVFGVCTCLGVVMLVLNIRSIPKPLYVPRYLHIVVGKLLQICQILLLLVLIVLLTCMWEGYSHFCLDLSIGHTFCIIAITLLITLSILLTARVVTLITKRYQEKSKQDSNLSIRKDV